MPPHKSPHKTEIKLSKLENKNLNFPAAVKLCYYWLSYKKRAHEKTNLNKVRSSDSKPTQK